MDYYALDGFNPRSNKVVFAEGIYDIFNESQNTPGRRYHSLHKDITISKDFNGLCAGFMIVKNTKFSKQFFNTCEFLKPTTISELPKSQNNMTHQYSNYYRNSDLLKKDLSSHFSFV